MLWTVPRIWSGETAVILASGPSMTAELAASVRGRARAIAVNNQGIPTENAAGELVPAFAPWADVLYAADLHFWNHNRAAALAFAGMKVTIQGAFPKLQHFEHPAVHVLQNAGPHGFDDRPTHLRTGRNSGYQAVHLAAHFGATRILLLGFDMKGELGRQHWFGEPKWRKQHQVPFSLFCREFAIGAPHFKARGVTIINCTPGSALTFTDAESGEARPIFPFQPIEEALRNDRPDEQAEGLQCVRESAPVHAEPVASAP